MFWYIVAVIFCYILLVRCFNCCHIRYLIQCDMLVSPCAVLVEGFLLLQLHTRVVSSFFFLFYFFIFYNLGISYNPVVVEEIRKSRIFACFVLNA